MADTRPFHPRVLLIAEACNPEWVSVPLVGWGHASALRDLADVHLVTQVRNREAIERAGLVHGKDFTAIDTEDIVGPIYRFGTEIRGGAGKGWTTLTALGSIGYYFFEHRVWHQFGAAIRRGDFDLVHRLTPLSPTMPSLTLSRKCHEADVPFMLGPLNGGVPWPEQFDSRRRAEKEWLSYVRDAYKLLPGYRSTRELASAILIASGATWRQMPDQYHDRCFFMPENAIDPARFAARRTRTAAPPLRLIYLGRLVPYKGADMIVEAAAPLARDGQVTLDLYGDGPEREKIADQIERHGVGEAIRLRGWVAHDQVQHRLAEADLLTFPSIREFGGGVVLEAMAVGCVPMVVDYGGPGELITPETGIGIELGDRQQIVERYRQTLTRLLDTPHRIDEMSAAAYTAAHTHHTWHARARQTVGIYQHLIDPTHTPRPHLPPPHLGR